MHVTITRTPLARRTRAAYALLAVGAVLIVGGIIGGLVEQVALARLTFSGAYEPLKTLPVEAHGTYLFPSGTVTTIDPRPFEVFVAIAVLGAVVLIAAAARRTIQRKTTTV